MDEEERSLKEFYRAQIEVECASGMLEPELVKERLLDSMINAEGLADDHPLIAELLPFVDEAFAAQALREATWTERTLNDALDDAFADLSRRGIGSALSQRSHEAEPADFTTDQTTGDRACVLWFREDLMNGTAGAQLCVQRPLGEKLTDEEQAALEREVAFVLAHHGVRTDGTSDDQIWPLYIPPFEWRKRRVTKAPPGVGPAPADVPPPPPAPAKCATCGGRGWIRPKDPTQFPTKCPCKG
jgi:hypothetical protein